MKITKILTVALLVPAFLIGPASALAADSKDGSAKKDEKAKPYPLKTCLVSNEKLDSMGEPYVFTHAGREIKLCCKECRKDFEKDTSKFLKKLNAADKKPKK